MPNAEYNINIDVTFRHTEPTDAIKGHAIDKLTQCFKKYIKSDANIHVILSVEKREHSAEVVAKAKGFDISTKSVTDDLYSAIDKVADATRNQLRKQKEKTVQTRHHASTY